MMRPIWMVLIIVGWVGLPSQSFAGAELNCTDKAPRVERRICRDPGLLSLQQSLRDVYTEKSDNIRPRSNVRFLEADQATWTAKRNRCIFRRCIVKAYKTRIAALSVPVVRRYRRG
jgi:uncharacterized protein